MSPLIANGHSVATYFCTYPFNDDDIEKEFMETVQPRRVHYCKYKDSMQYTTKSALFQTFEDDGDLDVIIWTRTDIHFKVPITEMDIQYDKFNFLFKEKGYWDDGRKFTTDNFHVWNHRLTPLVKQAMMDTIALRCDRHTHAIHRFIVKYMKESEYHFISPDKQELSNVNSFYSLCRYVKPLDNAS